MLQFAWLAVAALGAGEGKAAAQGDGRSLSILEVGAGPAGGPLYLRVAAGDLDGDGRADEAFLKILCVGGEVREAMLMREVKAPRDASSGQASGRRQHASVRFVKEWGAATPQLKEMKPTYDVKKVEGSGARMAGGWWAVDLAASNGLCPASEAAAATIVKSKSNITNN